MITVWATAADRLFNCLGRMKRRPLGVVTSATLKGPPVFSMKLRHAPIRQIPHAVRSGGRLLGEYRVREHPPSANPAEQVRSGAICGKPINKAK
jgi:hypothetical protein